MSFISYASILFTLLVGENNKNPSPVLCNMYTSNFLLFFLLFILFMLFPETIVEILRICLKWVPRQIGTLFIYLSIHLFIYLSRLSVSFWRRTTAPTTSPRRHSRSSWQSRSVQVNLTMMSRSRENNLTMMSRSRSVKVNLAMMSKSREDNLTIMSWSWSVEVKLPIMSRSIEVM